MANELAEKAEGLQEFVCEKHGKYLAKAQEMRLGNRVFSMPVQCPICQYEADRTDAVKREQAEKREREAALVKQNIDLKYWDEGFDTFNAYTPELERHKKTCLSFAQNANGKLVMLGVNGAGKTHLAVSILKKTGGAIYTFFEICLMLKQTYAGGGTNEWEVIKKLCEAPLLVIDEVGRSKGSDWELNVLSHIFNKRHANYRPTILISNRHLKDDCKDKGCPKCLENFFDNDVISRIIEDGIVMKFAGEDYRGHKRLEGAR